MKLNFCKIQIKSQLRWNWIHYMFVLKFEIRVSPCTYCKFLLLICIFINLVFGISNVWKTNWIWIIIVLNIYIHINIWLNNYKIISYSEILVRYLNIKYKSSKYHVNFYLYKETSIIISNSNFYLKSEQGLSFFIICSWIWWGKYVIIILL